MVDEGVDQNLEQPRQPRRRHALEVDPADHLGERLRRLRMRADVRERLEIGEQHAHIDGEPHRAGQHAGACRGIATQGVALDGPLHHGAVHLAEQMAAHAAIARLALLVHEEVLGGVELQPEHLLVAPQEGEVLPHLGDLGGGEGGLARSRCGEAARLRYDRGSRPRGSRPVATLAPPAPPAAARTARTGARRARRRGAASGWRLGAHDEPRG